MKGVFDDFRPSVLILIFSLMAGFLIIDSVAIADVTVNVKTDLNDLGCPDGNALGDGNNNDDAAINWAIDYVIAQGGGTVYCPAGTYRVERVYLDTADVNFLGEGRDVTIFRPHPDGLKSRLFDFRGGSLKNVTIYGTYPDDSGEDWILEGHEGCNHGILVTDMTTKSLIKNVRVLEIKDFALYVRDSKGLWVIDSEFGKAQTVVAIDPSGDSSTDITEEFVFANCTFGPYRRQYTFDIEPTVDEIVRNGVILNCQFSGIDNGKYGTNVNLWNCFLAFKGFDPAGERRNVAVVGCDFDNVYIYINRIFPDNHFFCNKINGDYPIFARPSYASVGSFPDTIVQGNYFVGKNHWSQIKRGVDFPGSSTFRCNTSSGANWDSNSWPDCNSSDITLLESATEVEDLTFSQLMHLCTTCPREVLEHFYDGYGNWESQAAFRELDEMKYEWLVEPMEPNSAGLIGWWKLNGDVNDSSGNDNHGSIVGEVGYVTGKIDQAIDIDNPLDEEASYDSNYVEVGGDESDYDINDAITVCAWIKMTTQSYEPNGYNKTRDIVAKGNSAWRLYMWSETRIRFHCSGLSCGDNYAMGGVDVTDLQWHHVAGVYDGSYLHVYIDGVLEDSLAATGNISTNDYKVTIGANKEVALVGWRNFIDDVRVYNYVLSQEEISYLAGLRNDLSEDGDINFKDFAILGNNWPEEEDFWPSYVGYWKFDEGGGTDANDSSVYENHGTLVNDPCWTTGQIDGALSFDGLDDYVNLGNKDIEGVFASGSSAFTISAWVEPNTLGTAASNHGTRNVILARASDSYNDSFELGISPTGSLDLYIDENNEDTMKTFGSGEITTGSWHHLACVFNYGSVDVYLDGNHYTGSFAGSSLDNATGSPVSIGTTLHSDIFFDGKIDDVQIYDRALSEEAIDQIYQEGSN